MRDDLAVDVAIVGAGPAGSACAISLRAHAPSLSVALIERSAPHPALRFAQGHPLPADAGRGTLALSVLLPACGEKVPKADEGRLTEGGGPAVQPPRSRASY
jgi:choline dehydrogenase-like flavoprotein